MGDARRAARAAAAHACIAHPSRVCRAAPLELVQKVEQGLLADTVTQYFGWAFSPQASEDFQPPAGYGCVDSVAS
mgnify:CR=1 FL=1